MNASATAETFRAPVRSEKIAKPRIGFLGVGWIGRHRMEAIAKSGLAEIAGIADSAPEPAAEAATRFAGAVAVKSLEELLELEVDGVVIATPSALHAEQAIVALERGVAVFCQKPLARNEAETGRVIDAARAADRLLGVDLSYRFMKPVEKVRGLVSEGELGNIFAADLVFHNAYGPDKPWFYDKRLSGGGCVIDLGIHLVDLALWMLGFPQVTNVTSRLFAQGEPLRNGDAVEDFAIARLDLSTGATVQLACSWKLPAGCDAIISGTFYGTNGSASFHNEDGSFYDFVAERCRGTKRQTLDCPAEEWGGKAAVDWARRLADDSQYDPVIERLLPVSATLDAIYGH
ncbi:MAG TPA: Gfo/Idh/MocA family oxidoreductase [Verrucomicrobiae bacterium]|nr:Gfo/Idh/MocA family oxidoreductase [Verrucomicrobiae bacterium]